MPDPSIDDLDYFEGLKRMVDAALADTRLAPKRAEELQQVSEQILPTYRKVAAGGNEAIVPLCLMHHAALSLLIINPSAKSTFGNKWTFLARQKKN